jgi:hypothetical protein
MADRLYVVRLRDGRTHPKSQQFRLNMENLKAKEPDYGGSGNLWLLKHHVDADTVRLLCTENFLRSREQDVEIEEVTTRSLNGNHIVYRDMVRNYWLPHGNFENIKLKD